MGAAALVAAGPAAAEPLAFDEGYFTTINGMEQWITVRGHDRANPVLLWLHGGPGFPMSGMAPLFFDWERRFTVVQWDQPGGGATFAKAPTAQGALTRERFIADGIAVIEHLQTKLKVRRVVLMGTSWGTQLGLELVRRRPDLVAAYVGTSQVVSGPRGNMMGYQMALEAARKRGDAAAVAALDKVGPPPYPAFEQWFVRQQHTNPPALPPTPQEAAAMAENAARLGSGPPPGARYVAALPPYDFIGQFMAIQKTFYGELMGFEAEALGLEFKVPMFIFQGDADLNTPESLAREYFAKIKAPAKGYAVIPGAGHNTPAFHGELLALLDEKVRPLVVRTAAPGP